MWGTKGAWRRHRIHILLRIVDVEKPGMKKKEQGLQSIVLIQNTKKGFTTDAVGNM